MEGGVVQRPAVSRRSRSRTPGELVDDAKNDPELSDEDLYDEDRILPQEGINVKPGLVALFRLLAKRKMKDIEKTNV